jgi:hypothetical protein
METPAARVISKFGGHKAVASAAGVDVSRVFRWTYPASRGGTDGVIPTRHQQRLLNEAHKQGIDLRPEDFFQPPSNSNQTRQAS